MDVRWGHVDSFVEIHWGWSYIWVNIQMSFCGASVSSKKKTKKKIMIVPIVGYSHSFVMPQSYDDYLWWYPNSPTVASVPTRVVVSFHLED